jgi:retron-type reverse transcriptase
MTFEEVASMENLCEAWQEFIRGKRKKKDVQEFMLRLGDELVELHADLADGTYVHGPYKHFSINDPKPRNIHKATVRDRLLHHAIHRKLFPYFAARFISDSFSCQNGKGVHCAINRFRHMARKAGKNNTRTCWILKCDIRKFFASIDHDILLGILRTSMEDVRLVALLERVIRSFEASPGKGIPLGNLTSQLFANVYMDVFDQFVKQRLKVGWYIRYADDFVLFADRREELVEALPRLDRFLLERLKLSMHPDKVFLKTLSSGIDFLGWVHFSHHRVPRTKTKRRALKENRLILKNETLQSYLGMFSHGDAHEVRIRLLNDYWFYRPR